MSVPPCQATFIAPSPLVLIGTPPRFHFFCFYPIYFSPTPLHHRTTASLRHFTNVQRVQTGIGASTVFDLVDAADPNRGLCSVVFVGVVPTAAQKLQLQDYSRNFKVSGCLPLGVKSGVEEVDIRRHISIFLAPHGLAVLSCVLWRPSRFSNCYGSPRAFSVFPSNALIPSVAPFCSLVD